MEELRERVARAIYDAWNMSGVPYDSPTVKGNVFREGKAQAQADAAILAVIEALAQEADRDPVGLLLDLHPGLSCVNAGATVERWLRSHLPQD